MRRLKIQNDKLNSEIVIQVKKVDSSTNCELIEECQKCSENSKVCFLLIKKLLLLNLMIDQHNYIYHYITLLSRHLVNLKTNS